MCIRDRSKKKLSFETQTKIGQWVSLLVGIFSIVVAMVLANGGVTSAYELSLIHI